MDTEIGLFLLLIGCILVGWALSPSSAAPGSPRSGPDATTTIAQVLPAHESGVVRVLTVTRDRRLVVCFERPVVLRAVRSGGTASCDRASCRTRP